MKRKFHCLEQLYIYFKFLYSILTFSLQSKECNIKVMQFGKLKIEQNKPLDSKIQPVVFKYICRTFVEKFIQSIRDQNEFPQKLISSIFQKFFTILWGHVQKIYFAKFEMKNEKFDRIRRLENCE